MFDNILRHCTDLAQLLDIFHMLFDAQSIGVTIVQPDGVIIYYNDAQARLDDLEPSKALGKVICDVYHYTPEESPTMLALRTGKPVFDRAHYYRTAYGKLVNSSNSIYPLWASGTLLGAICFIQSYGDLGKQVGLVLEREEPEPEGGARPPARAKQVDGGHYLFSSLVGQSPALQEAVRLAKKVAPSSSSVMLVGETGVGKEIFAQAIHYESARKNRPYTAVNCSAVPETLLECILFGTTKGAFTGAVSRAGLFEATEGGTLYLDEVDSMPVSLQNKLLRVLQEKKVRRVGEGHERAVDVRVVSSVGRNPVSLVEEGLLRQDFYYRLGVFKILIPPLRSRMEDVHLLVQHFLQKHCEALGVPVPLVTPEALTVFYSHAWPGNVRELEHAIEASLPHLEAGGVLEPGHLYQAVPDFTTMRQPREAPSPWPAAPPPLGPPVAPAPPGASVTGFGGLPTPPPSFSAPPAAAFAPPVAGPAAQEEDGRGLAARTQAVEAASIESALRTSAGNVALAARLLGVSPQRLHYKMKKYAIAKRDFLPETL